MKRNQLFFQIFLLVLAVLLIGCTVTSKPTPTPLTLISPVDTSMVQATSPLSTPIPDLPGWNDMPAPGKGVVRGYIKLTQTTILLGELFLASAVPTSDPNISLLELDESVSPRAVIDRTTDQFIFTDIEPGKYGLIAWEPMSSFAVNDPKTRQTLFFEVEANGIVDLGELTIP